MVKYPTLAREFFLNMFPTIFVGLSLLSNLVFATPSAKPKEVVLGSGDFSLEKRYPNQWVSNVFKDNILLTLAYLRGTIHDSNIDWTEVEKPFHYEFKLEKNQVFAFHSDVLPQYKGEIVKTTDAHFNSSEGFKSDGWLVGDGVCHLASFINMVAKKAGLDVLAPTNHNFAAIPQVPEKFGVAIYDVPGQSASNELQNLYVRNNKDKEISIAFDYDGTNLKVSVEEN